ncbi:MAG TPA: hypothetical protein VNI54_09205 [Thermoanaerobaculia bacterium]|nr:hypothetical protein [Thermoanaerobaculia bacterium]
MTPLLMVAIALYGLPLAWWARVRGYALAGASFLLGAGAVSLTLFVMSVIGVEWTRASVLIAIAPLFLASLFLWWRTGNPACPPQPGQAGLPALHYVVDVLVIVPIVAYAYFALYAPPFEWDFYGVWGIKGRWFFDAGGIDWNYIRTNSSHPDYPLLLPLLFDFVAVISGGWDDMQFGWIYVTLCTSFILIARGHGGALVALAVAMPALNPWIGLAEAVVMAFGCAGVLFLRREHYTLGAVMLGFAAWSKNEGAALLIAAAIALLIAKRKILVLWPALVMIAPWFIVRRVFNLVTDLSRGEVLARIMERISEPSKTMKALATAPPDQPYLWLAVLAIVAICIRQAWQRERFLLLALLFQAAAMMAAVLATPFDLGMHARFSLNRIPHQIVPAAVFLAAVLVTRGLSAPSPSAGSLPQPRPSTD